jgi:hypothetical protein
MKLTIIILFTFISHFSFSQIEINMASERESKHRKNGEYYLKDMNNYILPYLGTWKYTYGNKEFRITLTKATKHHVVFTDYNINYYTDGLYIQYQKFENGLLIYNSPVRSNPTGIIKEFGKLSMSFTDYHRNNEIFDLDMSLSPITGQLGSAPQYQLFFEINAFESKNTYYTDHPNEPFFSVPEGIIMTKM